MEREPSMIPPKQEKQPADDRLEGLKRESQMDFLRTEENMALDLIKKKEDEIKTLLQQDAPVSDYEVKTALDIAALRLHPENEPAFVEKITKTINECQTKEDPDPAFSGFEGKIKAIFNPENRPERNDLSWFDSGRGAEHLEKMKKEAGLE